MAEKIMQGIKQISELIGQAVKKRVVCLYRVSTVGQVEKDDIPMQKQYCREFCRGQSGWEIVKEFSEKGVSGFKVSAKDRDAIQEIQKMALKGEFDILLVFMFDRLGRRDDETPFVVEWFVKQGIEVWSAMEGQQRFDTHVDKLLNYIRYWQASGESIKTSLRVKTRLEQLTQEGYYTGGRVPFGYQAVKRGRINKKNHEVRDLAIEPGEAEVMKIIFQKYVYEGYGALRLHRYLMDQGLRTKDGKTMAVLTASMAGLPRCRASDKVSICLSTGDSTMPSWVRSLRYIRRNAAWMLSSLIRPLGQSAAFLSCLRHTQETYPAFEILRMYSVPHCPQMIFRASGV